MRKRLDLSLATLRRPLLCGAALMGMALAGCGQKGPLQHPTASPPASAASTTSR